MITYESIRQWYLKFARQGLEFPDKTKVAAAEEFVPATVPVSRPVRGFWVTIGGDNSRLALALVQALAYRERASEERFFRAQDELLLRRLREQLATNN